MLDPSHTTTDNIASCMSSFRESEESDSETEPLSNLLPNLEQLRGLMEQLQTAMTEVVGEERMQQMHEACLLYTSPSPRDATLSRMPSSA